MNSRVPKSLFALLVLYVAGHFAYYYPQMTSVVASHFDAHGAANGWQTKQAFFGVLSAVIALVSLVALGVPKLLSIMPIQLINLPNKEYWLAPGQRTASMEFLQTAFAWFGCALLLVLIVAFNYAVQSNLRPSSPPNPAQLWYVLAGFGAFSLAWMIRMMLRFSRTPANR